MGLVFRHVRHDNDGIVVIASIKSFLHKLSCLDCLPTLSYLWICLLSTRDREEQGVRLFCLQLRFSNYTRYNMDLIKAVQTNDLERVRLLVEQGADKEKGNIHGWTPLLQASSFGHLEVTQYLVEQGATLEKANNAGDTPLIIAAFNGHLEVCRYLLEEGADRDKAAIDGWTPLHCAADQGYLEIAMLLMSYGADLNVRTNRGELPIDVADTEKMRQAIRDEPRRRMDHGHKRATEQNRHPNASGEQGEEEQSNKRPRFHEGGELAAVAAVAEEIKVAEEDEDSEPSDGEEDD